MPAFYYSPQASDQRAEIISRAGSVIAGNVAQGAQSLAQTLSGLKQKHDELKAKKALAEAFADQLGVDAKSVDKLKLPQLDAFLTLAPSKIQQKQTQQQSGIMGNALNQWAQGARTPTPASGTDLASAFMGGAAGSRMPGVSGPVAMAGRMAQGNPPDIGATFAQALASAAGSGATPDTISALANLGKTVSAMYSRGMTADPSTGLRMFNGRPLPAATQKLLGFGGGAPGGQDMQFTPGPSGTEFWRFGDKGGQVRTPATAPTTIPTAPTVEPPKGYEWIWNGKEWTMAKGQYDAAQDPDGSGTTPNSRPAPAQPEYKTPDDVSAAYKSGKLTYDQASELLTKLGVSESDE